MKKNKRFEGFVYNPWECGYALGEHIPSPIETTKFVELGIDDLGDAHLVREIFKHNCKYNRPSVLKMPYFNFMMGCELLSAPGSLIEEYFCKGMERVSSHDEMGDRKNANSSFQFKVTIIDAHKTKAMFNRISIWQDTPNYWCVIVNKPSRYAPRFYVLTKKQMTEELKILRAIPTNGTKKSNRFNKRNHMSISFECDKNNRHFIRWEKSYRRIDLEEGFISRCVN